MNTSERRFEIHCGLAENLLPTLPDNFADSLVTDPPSGIGFMPAKWDSNKGGRDLWIAWLASVMKEARRAMKPGAYGLVWALPRTSHWTGMAVEDAGFVVRDRVSHVFSQGFPKNHDISKNFDKAAGAQRGAMGRIGGDSDES